MKLLAFLAFSILSTTTAGFADGLIVTKRTSLSHRNKTEITTVIHKFDSEDPSNYATVAETFFNGNGGFHADLRKHEILATCYYGTAEGIQNLLTKLSVENIEPIQPYSGDALGVSFKANHDYMVYRFNEIISKCK